MTDKFTPAATDRDPSGSMGRSQPPASDFQDLKDKVSEDLAEARDAFHEERHNAESRVKETIEGQKNFAAHQVGGIATALEKVGAELETSDQRQVGRYAREIGRSVQGLAQEIEGKDLGEVAAMAEDFGRRQPLAFLGVAALAGLAASRFLTASAHRAGTAPKRPVDTAAAGVHGGGVDHG